MHNQEQHYQVFTVKYHRQGGTNQWKAATNLELGIKALNAEGVMGLETAQWEGQTKADENHMRIDVSVERDPRFFELSPQQEEGWMAMTEKANKMADQEFLKRHPGAKIERKED